MVDNASLTTVHGRVGGIYKQHYGSQINSTYQLSAVKNREDIPGNEIQ